MAFELPKLNYAFDALEPNIDAKTMEIHYGKHHNGYTNNLNNIISGTDNEGKSIEDICRSLLIQKYPSWNFIDVSKSMLLFLDPSST